MRFWPFRGVSGSCPRHTHVATFLGSLALRFLGGWGGSMSLRGEEAGGDGGPRSSTSDSVHQEPVLRQGEREGGGDGSVLSQGLPEVG